MIPDELQPPAPGTPRWRGWTDWIHRLLAAPLPDLEELQAAHILDELTDPPGRVYPIVSAVVAARRFLPVDVLAAWEDAVRRGADPRKSFVAADRYARERRNPRHN